MSDAPVALKRVRWIEEQGQRVLLLDFSNANPQESLDLINEFSAVADQEPDESILMLTDVTGAVYEASIAQKWKNARFARNHKIKRSAVWGLKGLIRVAIMSFQQALTLLGKKTNFKIVATREDAVAFVLEK